MNKSDIKKFFDNIADSWDDESVYNQDVISYILDKAEVSEGKRILDIACGTGFLFNDYYSRKIGSVTGVDISEKMLEKCTGKFPEARLICADAEEYKFNECFDVILIHNAFPHFCDSKKLFSNLTSFLSCGGRLTVSHDMSRSELNSFHGKRAADVSMLLPKAESLAEIMREFLSVDTVIDNNNMYIVSGIKI